MAGACPRLSPADLFLVSAVLTTENRNKSAVLPITARSGPQAGRRVPWARAPRGRYWKRMRRRATTIRAATAIAARMPRRLLVMTRFVANTRFAVVTQAFFLPTADDVAQEGTDGGSDSHILTR